MLLRAHSRLPMRLFRGILEKGFIIILILLIILLFPQLHGANKYRS
ncbi:hypothetical protein VHARVF571_510046 [Vibrio harveyi]|nr:hypothetical protein VHARVF571_510046 [Vibrio harveyi]